MCAVAVHGYAVFEDIRACATPAGTRIFKAEEHCERLHHSCRSIGLPFSYLGEELTDIICQLLVKNGLVDADIRPLVYVDTPNMTLKCASSSNLLIAVWDWRCWWGIGLFLHKKPPAERGWGLFVKK